MEEAGEMRQITNVRELDEMIALWNDSSIPDEKKAIGYILSLEGADSIRSVGHLEKAWDQGLRAMGPAHYGVCRYALGHDTAGPLPAGGKELIQEMDRLGMILDVTHLSDECFWQALEIHQGTVWASHSNCRALVPDPRQFSDDQIKALIARGGVMGAALDAWMMVPGWTRGKTTPQEMGLKLEVICDHIDHVCQLAGNALHSGIGAGSGWWLRHRADAGGSGYHRRSLTHPRHAEKRGYKAEDIANIMHGNYLRLLREAWAE